MLLSIHSYKLLREKGFLIFDTAQYDGILKKLSEFNRALHAEKDLIQLSLKEVEYSRVGAVVKILRDSSHYHSSNFADVDIDLLFRVLSSWPLSMIFPVIDILRMLILHPDGASKLLKHINGGNDALMELIKKVTKNPMIPANVLTGLRAINSLFKNTCFHQWLQHKRYEILDTFSGCYTSNGSSQLAYATLILNFAVLLIEKRDEEGQLHVLSAAFEIAEVETMDVDSKFRALVAIGSLMLDGSVREVALELDVESIAKAAKSSKESKIAEVGADIELLAKQQ